MRQARFEGVNWWQVVGLIALAVATVVIAFLAMGHSRPEVPEAGETPGYTPATENADENEQSAAGSGDTGSPQEEQAEITPVPALSRIIAMQDAQVGYRAATGSCPDTTATIEVTADGGVTWAATDDEQLTQVSSPLRLLPGTDGFVSMVAQNRDDCSVVTVLQSYTAAADWDVVEGGTDMTWYLDPADASIAHVPGVGAVNLPCEAARLATTNATTGAVLCTDNTVATTDDQGENWNISDPLAGAQAIAFSGEKYLLARTGQSECSGTTVSRLTLGHSFETVVCVADLSSPGKTALAATPEGQAWLWSGDRLASSADAGENWQLIGN